MIQTDVAVRDPFVLVYEGRYYLYGTRVETCWGYADGFDVYVSDDLIHWSDAVEVFHNDGSFWADQNYWAPEVHRYHDKFYMFASFKKEGKSRGTQILCADQPTGPFVPISEGPVTPDGWECLDGTLFVDEDGQPYIVFCHEWAQIGNGTMCAMKLSEDLREAIGEPVLLFDAKSTGWTVSIEGEGHYVTDGPFLYRTKDDALLMLWSSHGKLGYAQAIARSTSGIITGPWVQEPERLFEKDGGHGMLFHTLDGQLMLALHYPNDTPNERACFLQMEEINGKLRMKQDD